MTLTEAGQRHRVAEANRRVANCSAAERRTEEVANAERRAAEAEQRAAEAERHANASVATRPIIARPSQPKPITAPAPTPAQRLTSKEIPVMSTRKEALFREVATTTARLAASRQSLEDAKFLARNCMAGDGGVVPKPERSMPGSKRAKLSRRAGTKGMIRTFHQSVMRELSL